MGVWIGGESVIVYYYDFNGVGHVVKSVFVVVGYVGDVWCV